MIRHSEWKDLDQILAIYTHARQFMKETGNPRQWGDVWPPEEVVREDIETGRGYVLVDENDIPHVAFHFRQGEHCDATYDVIHDGAWLAEGSYGVVHRIASDGVIKGGGRECIAWALAKSGHLRIDTHGDNKVMQKVLSSMGFTHTGIIYVEEDNDPRLAFEKILG